MTVAVRPMPTGSAEWLSIREASELVGVSVATLRRWCDAGEVHAFTTPGGHRRFARSAVLQIADPVKSTQRVAGNAHVWARAVRACRHELRHADDAASPLSRLSVDSRRELRRQSLVVLRGLFAAIDARSGDREPALAPARSAITECVRIADGDGLTLSESLALALHFRGPLLRELGAATQRLDCDARTAAGILLAASDALDVLLTQLVDAFVKIEAAKPH